MVALQHRLDGPPDAPVLLLNGPLAFGPELWDAEMPALTEHFRVLRYRHRGCPGADPAPAGPIGVPELTADVLELLDTLGIERAHWVGLCMGGLVSLWAAAHHPGRVETLTTMSTTPKASQTFADLLGVISNAMHSNAYKRYHEYGRPFGWGEHADLVAREGLAAEADQVVKAWFTPDYQAANPAEVAIVREAVCAADPEVYQRICRGLASRDLTPLLARIEVPLLILAAEEDWSVPPGTSRALTLGVTGSTRVVVFGAGHLLTRPDSALVTDHVVAHALHRSTAVADLS
ncbi:alpha/beta fold hydrolase [Pseudonocardia pini]|uniref:alpha/beta fold hydrolase n=1 Tax=Pseudonocardia pini TaxID=2758030 RepID=UPI0015F04724|nr:alpha/beta hydrolase [Pseudonocardia pini]